MDKYDATVGPNAVRVPPRCSGLCSGSVEQLNESQSLPSQSLHVGILTIQKKN